MTAKLFYRNSKSASFLSFTLQKAFYKPVSFPGFPAFFVLLLFVFSNYPNAYSQQFQSPPIQSSSPYLSKSSIFRQEIARLDITVQRAGKQPISLTQVPRVEAGDILKVKMLDEAVGGIRPDQSNWDWTLLIAYINPNRNEDKQKTVWG